ncbi:MAG: hypothetical protein MUF09_11885 [Candidatus Nanopelagicales bacterium]|nr:hypothetical protein [Candidatus Nanopelagicales bacterium]
MRGAHRVRAIVNWVNLSTPSGLVLARVAAGRPRRARNGMWLVHGYRLPIPPAPAFTVGSVVLLRAGLPGAGRDPVGAVPRQLLDHEERHVTQYAWCGGVLMPIGYVAAAGWSWLRTGDFASRNVFERRAGLADGGYRERPLRPLRRSGRSREGATRV